MCPIADPPVWVRFPVVVNYADNFGGADAFPPQSSAVQIRDKYVYCRSDRGPGFMRISISMRISTLQQICGTQLEILETSNANYISLTVRTP